MWDIRVYEWGSYDKSIILGMLKKCHMLCVVSLGFLVDNKVQLLNCLDIYEATLPL